MPYAEWYGPGGMPLRARRLKTACLGLILLVAACQRPHHAAPVVQTVKPTSPSPAQRLSEEARWLARYPDVATRDGPTLVIRHGGAEVARYVDDPKGCNPYSISKVVELYDDASRRRLPVAEVTCRFGPLDNRYLVLPSSDKYMVRDDVEAAPDGKTLATADNALGDRGGRFTLVAWPSLQRIAQFKAGCRRAQWRDSDHLSAVCWHNDGSAPQDADDSRSIFFTADIGRDSGGAWSMTATGFVDGATGKPVAADGRPLPHFAAEVPPPDRRG